MHLSTNLTYNGAKPTVNDLQNPNPAQQLPTLDRETKPRFTSIQALTLTQTQTGTNVAV
jgi:hypothetical protein